VEEPQVTQHQAIETEQREEPVPEPVPETPKKDEPFNQIVAFAVGALVFQIVRALGINLGALTVVFLIVPIVLLVRYVKKQTTQVYAGIIGALVVVMGIVIAAGPGDVFVPQAVETTSDGTAPQPIIRENTSAPQPIIRENTSAPQPIIRENTSAPQMDQKRVRLPDGTIIEIPDGLSVEAQISFLEYVQSKYETESSSQNPFDIGPLDLSVFDLDPLLMDTILKRD
jgi:hypothetical protein